MTEPYRIRSLTLCDDARVEHNGKEILIGVYTGVIVANSEPPITLPSLTVRLELDISQTAFESAGLDIIDPSGKQVIVIKGNAAFARPDEPASMAIQFGPVTLPMKGVYAIRFGMDKEPTKIGEFKVRMNNE